MLTNDDRAMTQRDAEKRLLDGEADGASSWMEYVYREPKEQ